MPETRIDSAEVSDLKNVVQDFSVDNQTTEGANGSIELNYRNAFWFQDYGYYLLIPEFKRAVDTKALWAIGGGFTADEPTELLLLTIKGNGKDSFNSILKNLIKIKTFTGDSFAEIIRDKDGVLVNIKPLDPSSIKIVQSKSGLIIRYEQIEKDVSPNKRFKPEEIFHLSHERMADEIKGTRIIPSLKKLIDTQNEAMEDWRTVLHRNVKPMRLWFLDTDVPSEITTFKAKTDGANANTENIYLPKGTVETEIATVAPNATLNPLPWIDMINDKFFQAVNVPQIIVGNAKSFTDASGKIVYLSYEQSVKDEQLYVEEQILGQLNLEINLTFPASLQNDLISSRESDSDLQASQPNDTTEELEGKS